MDLQSAWLAGTRGHRIQRHCSCLLWHSNGRQLHTQAKAKRGRYEDEDEVSFDDSWNSPVSPTAMLSPIKIWPLQHSAAIQKW